MPHPEKRDFDRLPRIKDGTQLPFSVNIGGIVYRGMPKNCEVVSANDGVKTTTEYKAEIGGLCVTCSVNEYIKYPVIEWIVYLDNRKNTFSSRVKDFYPIDTEFTGKYPIFEYSNGDSCTPDGYEIYRSDLNEPVTLIPSGGVSCCGAFPYMRLDFNTYGYNIAIGYTGSWKSIAEKADNGVHYISGQEIFDTVILPGERMISPRITVMSYQGNTEHGRCLWRRWYIDCILPKCGGEPIKPMLSLHNYGKGPESTCATEESQITAIDTYVAKGLKPDFWWLDAGWYPCNHVWQKTGTWFENKANFPRGLAPVGKHCEELGIKFLLWFEPERVSRGSWIDRNHPEWVLYRKDSEGLFGLLNLGDDTVLQKTTDYFDSFIKRCHVGIYRQDFNIAPAENWRENEADNRKGALENRHIQGYYKFWDALLERNPGLIIDSCASGGRRNDLETMRRAVAFHYTDVGYGLIPIKQKQHRLMFEWIPYFRSHTHSWDDENGEYSVRRKSIIDDFNYQNNMSPAVTNLIPYNASDEEFALAVKMNTLHVRAGEYMMKGDYYPLSECRRSNRDYYALQFDKDGEGYFQIIANTKAKGAFVPKLRALKPDAVYLIENGVTGEIREYTGAELTEGIDFKLKPRSGELWFYKVK